MFNDLGQAALKNGQPMSVGRVDAPCPEWRPRLMEFLKHKGEEWRDHLGLALESSLDELQSHFYVGLLQGSDDDFVCHIMVAESRGVGLLGHVFTQPEHRQKGAIRALMSTVIDDCAARGVRVISLNTVHDSPAYHIYAGFVFTSAVPGGGSMIREFEPGVTLSMLTPSTARVRPLTWDDWPALNLLSIQPGLATVGPLEGLFIRYQLARMADQRINGTALVNRDGDTVGWSTIAPSPNSGGMPTALGGHVAGDEWVLDAQAAPHFQTYYDDLIGALTLPNETVKAYSSGGPKADALIKAGFTQNEPATFVLAR